MIFINIKFILTSTINFCFLTLESIYKIFLPPFRIKETIHHFYFVANQSLFIIVFCVCFAAIVTILEASFHMKIVIKNDAMVPGFAAVLILRELAAVISGLLLTSRVGAGIAAEVGSMKVTEQLDAIKMLGVDEVSYIVTPRFIACILGGFILSIIASVICVFCAMIISQLYLGYTYGLFVSAMNRFVSIQDIWFSSIKGAFFGAIIPLVSCYNGFRCDSGAQGVGLATTNSVVISSIAIIISDFVLSWIFSHYY